MSFVVFLFVEHVLCDAHVHEHGKQKESEAEGDQRIHDDLPILFTCATVCLSRQIVFWFGSFFRVVCHVFYFPDNLYMPHHAAGANTITLHMPGK